MEYTYIFRLYTEYIWNTLIYRIYILIYVWYSGSYCIRLYKYDHDYILYICGYIPSHNVYNIL